MFQDFSYRIRNNVYLCSVVALLLLTPLYQILGATETFTVPAIVGTDTTPPSIPGNVSAVPVATTQIDLSWDASSDNFLLSGYHIWRDDVQIATTTLTTYSDTGLTSSTTYTYYITAFDSVFNESASSSVVATTTLSPAPIATTTPPATTSTRYGSRMHPLADEILSMSIYPERDAVVIHYTTLSHIRASVRWGETTSYEYGSLIEDTFTRTHRNRIEGLNPGTKYYFSLGGENSIGRQGDMFSGTFTTLAPVDVFAPENVSDLTVRLENEDVFLSWKNPEDSDFDKVRVVRNDSFYPNDIADGWVVYEGAGSEARDRNVLEEGERTYYTIFAYDALGNISSGAVISVYRKIEGGATTTPVEEEVVIDPSKNSIAVTWDDLKFTQEGTPLLTHDGSVVIDGSKQLHIALPYDRVPEHLKTILVSVAKSASSDEVFTFLLRINMDKTAYTSTIAPFGISGSFPMQLSVFDYTTSQIGYVSGMIESRIEPVNITRDTDGAIARMLRMVMSDDSNYGAIITTVFVILALVLLAFLGRRIMHH